MRDHKKMIVIGVRHDSLSVVKSSAEKNDFNIEESNYSQPILKSLGLIKSAQHPSFDADNILLTQHGTRYINSSSNSKICSSISEKVKETENGIVYGIEGIDLAAKEILKSDNAQIQKSQTDPLKITDSGEISLFYINGEDVDRLKEKCFQDIVKFIVRYPEITEERTLFAGNYSSSSGDSIYDYLHDSYAHKHSAPKYLGTLGKNTMAMLHLEDGVVSIFALPNVNLDLKSPQFERELAKGINVGVEEKVEHKISASKRLSL